MNKKTLFGLILFSCVVISGMFLTTEILIEHSSTGSLQTQLAENNTEEKALNNENEEYVRADNNIIANQELTKEESDSSISVDKQEDQVKTIGEEESEKLEQSTDITSQETKNQITQEPDKQGKEQSTEEIQNKDKTITNHTSNDKVEDSQAVEEKEKNQKDAKDKSLDDQTNASKNDTVMASADAIFKPQLILDHTKVDYMSHIPKMKWDSDLKKAMDIKNPKIDLEADAAILLDAKTGKVLYYKNPVKAEFPASTLKLLTAMIALKNCDINEEVTIGDEITMIASDSSRAYLKQGEKLTIENLLQGMLLPSGNDAAYAVAAYVGRKTLNNPKATKEEALSKFRKMMNQEAGRLGLKNSNFVTPDGYDAIGQYTTAYDMGLIGMAAIKYSKIVEISQKSSCSTKFISGEEVTWTSTNKLLNRKSGDFYSPAFGLKTGTSTMAGKCLVSAAKNGNKEVVCVIMHSNTDGRWEDAIKLMDYGLK